MIRGSIAIIGGGPIGLEAAVAGIHRGYRVELFESGEVAASVKEWGHVRMFSPFGMNRTPLGMNKLRETGIDLPHEDALLTGREFREQYLLPLAATLPEHVLHEHSEVLGISRVNRLKTDFIAEADRSLTPFRILIRNRHEERVIRTDYLLDCSGTYRQPNRLGDGGIPVAGESAAADYISYSIPDLSEPAVAERYHRKRVLVVGSGHSAATAISRLAGSQQTIIHWLTRQDRAVPLSPINLDPLPERAGLAATANELVKTGRVLLHRGATIEAITPSAGCLTVTINNRHATEPVEVDEIIAATGFRPDLSIARELQVQTCWATEGTYPLAASLLGEAGSDCLKTPAFGVDMLKHPEPGFFTLGMKSYGRSPNFLLRTGHEQLQLVIDSLGKD